jgi:putative membrane-bound dehydrogenase-like protein
MWVTQYRQYPFPKGLKIVEYDRYIRAKFDKTPLPPPRGDKGADCVTIHEDTDGDGTFDKATVFVDGLNIATAALPGKGGVWVMNPPYLLFYPDANGDDVPDGDPVVHLSGFGLEDTHAVANSLTWGPDGWIYGAQGSTCTAKVKVEVGSRQSAIGNPTTDFLGQAIWRYHPERHVFEIFAEGGGNTFGVEFDDQGRLFSGTNFGVYRGVHYVQGGYYVKSWGKHGPLTNPYAFGYFEHMPHTGDATRLVHTFSVYGGGLMPELTGKLIGPNPLQSRVQVTRREAVGSTFKTVEEAPLLTSDDGWFRPVDLKVGPDGAIYVCDFYENRISHVDPRDTWDRSNGRICRIRPAEWKPSRPADLSKVPGRELIEKLSDPNRLVRSTALRLIGERQDRSLLPAAREMLTKGNGQAALEGLWAANLLGGLDEATALAAMGHGDPHVRAWAVRLLGDRKELLASPLAERLVELAKGESDPQVRSQLASSAKRLPGDQALPVLREMLAHPGDEKDRHIPLLVWWAVEAHLRTDRDAVVGMFKDAGLWASPLVRQTVAQRVARWLAASNQTPAEDQRALAALIEAAPGEAERTILLAGVNEAFEGRPLGTLAPELAAVLAKSGNTDLAVRAGDKRAVAEAIASIANDDPKLKDRRIKTIELLGQVGPAEAAPVLLDVARTSRWHSVRKAALAAVTRFNDPAIGRAVVEMYGQLPKDQGVRPAAIGTLLARKAWAMDLLRGIDAGAIPKGGVSADQLARLRQFDDKAIAGLMQKVFGEVARPTSGQKAREIARVKEVVGAGRGDAAAGKAIFTQRCAACHTLFKEGGQVGPDLTPYERRNLDFLLVSIVAPSAAIREEYTNFRIDTSDDQTFVGLIKERGSDSVTVADAAGQRTVIPKRDVRDERALTVSIMPEGLLDGLSEGQLRDLFAYLQSSPSK